MRAGPWQPAWDTEEEEDVVLSVMQRGIQDQGSSVGKRSHTHTHTHDLDATARCLKHKVAQVVVEQTEESKELGGGPGPS